MITMALDFGSIAILGFVLLIIGFVWIFSTRYKKCPSDQIMVVYGKVGKGRASLCLHGGAKFIIPLIQANEFISLRPMSLNINLQNALSNQNIRINVPSTFTIGVSTDPAIMSNAAERLLGLQRNEIEEMASLLSGINDWRQFRGRYQRGSKYRNGCNLL